MQKIAAALAALLIASCSFGQGRAIPSERPKLIVEIVVTQMRYLTWKPTSPPAKPSAALGPTIRGLRLHKLQA